MAEKWTYGDWRRQSTATEQRARLILHVEEVEAMLGGFESQSAQGQSAKRFTVITEYLTKLYGFLEKYDQALGKGLDAKGSVFVGVKPRIE